MAGNLIRRIIKGTGGGIFGSSTNYSNFSTTGFLTAASTARPLKELWIPATALFGGEPVGSSACTHATTGSLLMTTLGADASGGRFYIPTISACGTACDMQINAYFPAPLDMDTTTSTASPILVIEHALNAAFTTASCTIGYRVNYSYVTAGSTTTSGSLTQGIVAAGACVAGARVSGSLGAFPVPAATGQMLHFALRQLTGACGQGSIADVVGVRFRYYSDRLGTQST